MSKAVNTGNGYPSGMKNRIINGGMDISQRGTSFAAANSYTLDRWFCSNVSDASATVTQSTDVPAGSEFQSSIRAYVDTADTSISSTQRAAFSQSIEGYNVRDLIGRTFTVSFWVRSTKTGIHCVAFRNSISDRSYVTEYTINISNTWEYKTITIIGGLITSGTWNWTNGLGCSVSWFLTAGSSFQTTPGSWQTGNFMSTANQVNCLDTVGNIFAITGVQLELGPVATPFEHRLYSAELALCQRYFYCLKQISGANMIGIGGCTSSTNAYCAVFFPVTMRVQPSSITLTSVGSITISGIGATAPTVVTLSVPSPHGTNLSMTSSAMTAGIAVFHWNAAGQLNFDGAEL